MTALQYDNVYDLNNGLDNGRYDDFGYENDAHLGGSAGSTALYHHNGTKYGLGMGARPNGDSKMNGLHGSKHKRGDVDRECMFIDLGDMSSWLTFALSQSIASLVCVSKICKAKFRRCAKTSTVAAIYRRNWRKVFRSIGT